MEGWAELCCCIAARISQLKSRRSSWTLAEGLPIQTLHCLPDPRRASSGTHTGWLRAGSCTASAGLCTGT